MIISIQDGNDPPVFLQSVYQAHIAESAAVGSRIRSVVAVDKDVRAPNNEFTYTILGGDGSTSFKIDAHSGAIETASALDRETQSVYNITVGAVDNGTPSQTGTCQVHIHVDDVNDNGPLFQPALPLGYVLENEPSGTSVMALRAIDGDLPPNGAPFTYAVVAGEHKDFFQVCDLQISSRQRSITIIITIASFFAGGARVGCGTHHEEHRPRANTADAHRCRGK